MKIRTKLISLVMGVVVVLAAAGGVYAALLGSATQIERERGYLISLNDAIKNQLIELNRLPYTALKAGSEQILQAMVDLQDRSVRVKEGSEAMNEGSSGIKRMMDDLSKISTEVTADISEISMSISDIGTSIRAVADFAEEVSLGSARLDEEVNRFKTTREEPRALEEVVENFGGSLGIDLPEECLEAG